MRSCDSLSDTRAREIDGVGVVDLFVGSNRGVGLVLLRSEHFGTLEVGIMNANFFPAGYVEKNHL